MSFDPVEGVHYIFDRYAFLNAIMEDGTHVLRISSESPDDDLDRAIKLARALHHPDKQSRSGKKKQDEAEWMSHKIGECEKLLLNAEIKPLYDEKLASFRATKPLMISTTGQPIINLVDQAIDIDSLLTAEVKDLSHFESQIQLLTQYDENSTALAKKLFTKMPDDEDARASYRKALTSKLVYITLMEDVAWAKIGVHNRQNKIDGHLMSSDDYAEKVESAMQTVRKTQIDPYIENRGDSARIGLSNIPLLLEFNDAAEKPLNTPSTALLDPARMQEITEKMKAAAHKNFEIRAEYVRDIAQRKQAVLQELVTLAPVTPLNNQNLDNPAYDFYLVDSRNDDSIVRCLLQLNAATGNGDVSRVFDGTFTVKDLKAMKLENNSLMVERNHEISDILIEVSAAADRAYMAVRDHFSKPAEPDQPHSPTTPSP